MRIHPVFRAMLGCGLALLLTASLGFAQGAKKKPQPAELNLPEGLKHVPLDAMGFVHIRVGDFIKSDLGKTLLQDLRKDREASKGLKEIEKTLGIEATDLESVTLLMLVPPVRMQINPWDGPRKQPIFDRKMDILPPSKAEGKKAARELEQKLLEERRRVEEETLRALEELKRAEEKRKRQIEQDKKEAEKKSSTESPIVFQDAAQDVEQQRAIERLLLEQQLQLQLQREFQRGDAVQDFDDFGQSGRPLVIVTSAKELDRKKILRALLFNAKPCDPFGPPMGDGPSVLFLSDRTVLVGSPGDLARYSEAMASKPKTQPLRSALALGVEPHLIVAGGHVPAEWRRLMFAPYMPQAREFAAFAPLLHTEYGITLDLGKSVDMKFQFNAPTEAGAANALQAVKTLRVLAELAIEKSREAGESGGAKLALEKALLKGLADAAIEQKGKTVSAELKLELGPTLYKKFMKDIVAQFRSRGDRTRSQNNLKQIGLALHSYHDANKFLPPAGITDGDGKPLLSWRVAILPYVEQGALYQQFDLNKPWDHPTNKKLIAQMPAIYMVPGADAKEGETNYRVLVGPGTMFQVLKGEGGQPVRRTLITAAPDGTSNTIMAVEAAQPTIWTRPDDLPYDPKGQLPKFGVTPDGFNALMGDGSVRFIRASVREDVLRPYLTGNNGILRMPLD